MRRESIKQAIKRYYQSFLELIEPVISLGIQQGEFRSIDPKRTAIAIGAMFEGTILLHVYFPEDIKFIEQFRTNLDLVFKGLLVAR